MITTTPKETIAKTPKETDEYEAFDLVANAWEEIDLYQGSADTLEERDLNQRSSDDAALEKAVEFLDDARDKDPEYFKAYYLSAITTYFTNPSRAAEEFKWIRGTKTTDATFEGQDGSRYWTKSENETKKSEDETKKGAKTTAHLDALNREIRFNLAAARLEAFAPTKPDCGEINEIIEEFKKLLKETKKDSPLNLLARSALALCKALTRNETERLRIWWRLWLIELFPWRIEFRKWSIRLRKIDIDKDTAAAIRKILRYVKDPELWEDLSGPDKPTGPPIKA